MTYYYLPTPPPTPVGLPLPSPPSFPPNFPPRRTPPSLLPAFPDASALRPAPFGVEDWVPTRLIQPIPLDTPRYRTNSTPVTYGSAFSASPISSNSPLNSSRITKSFSEVSEKLRSEQQSQMIAQLSTLNLEDQNQNDSVAESQSPQMAQVSPPYPHRRRLVGKGFEREDMKTVARTREGMGSRRSRSRDRASRGYSNRSSRSRSPL